MFKLWRLGDANETFFVVDDVLRVDWAFSIYDKQAIEVVQKKVFLVVVDESERVRSERRAEAQ